MDIEFELILSAKLLLALSFGAIIGFEREREQQNTGVRTFACICVAACLFISIAAHLSEDRSAVSRMLAAIATGLGFIGAGMVFRDEKNMPRGLTTASGLWITSAVGVAIAMNMFVLSVAATAVTLFIFSLNRFRWYKALMEQQSKGIENANQKLGNKQG